MASQTASTNILIGALSLDALRRDREATDDELKYLQDLVNLRSKKRAVQPAKKAGYNTPSVIIDDFLYHGDLKHARNMNLLTDLNIRHIVNVSNFELDHDTHNHFNVLWINLDDDFNTDISQHFEKTNEFLNSCKTNGEKVLVHCEQGISRSSSIVLAYLLRYYFDLISFSIIFLTLLFIYIDIIIIILCPKLMII